MFWYFLGVCVWCEKIPMYNMFVLSLFFFTRSILRTVVCQRSSAQGSWKESARIMHRANNYYMFVFLVSSCFWDALCLAHGCLSRQQRTKQLKSRHPYHAQCQQPWPKGTAAIHRSTSCTNDTVATFDNAAMSFGETLLKGHQWIL